MVVIRLQRLGTKKTPHHRIVVTERSKAQSSQVLEVIGYYNPAKTPVEFSLNAERYAHWKSVGSQVSEATQLLVNRFASAKKPA